jgi:hypothetical protein
MRSLIRVQLVSNIAKATLRLPTPMRFVLSPSGYFDQSQSAFRVVFGIEKNGSGPVGVCVFTEDSILMVEATSSGTIRWLETPWGAQTPTGRSEH